MKEISLEKLVEAAQQGQRAALEELIPLIQDKVYNLAVRMLWHPADAEDATQEILIKVITHLSQFRGESAFTTWVYRVATNHLLTTRKRRAELRTVTLETMADGLEVTQAETQLADTTALPDEQAIFHEMQLRCTLGMLLCLEREQRVAFILAEGFGIGGDEGAYILEITPATFRKRVSRARLKLRDFMQDKCGLVDTARECNCRRFVRQQTEPQRLQFASALVSLPLQRVGTPTNFNSLQNQMNELDQLGRVAAIFRSQPTFAAPNDFALAVRQMLDSGKFSILSY